MTESRNVASSPEDVSGTPQIRLECFPTFDEAKVDRSAWDEAVMRLGGSIYFTYDWVRTWWEFYGRGMELRLFVFWLDGNIVGILPIYLDRIGFLPLRLSVGRLVGANIPPKPFELPLDSTVANTARNLLLEHLLFFDNCDVVSVGPLAMGSSSSCEVLSTSGIDTSSVEVQRGYSDVHTRFVLPDTMGEYLSGLANKERKKRDYESRLLRREYTVRVETCASVDSSMLVEFERFAQQHSMQWKQEGLPGHFGAWPQALTYNRKLVERLSRLGRVRVVRILANEEIIARHYVFAFGGRWYWELPSRATDSRWSRISLGSVAAVCMINQAIEEKVRFIEAGLGEYGYKRRLNALEQSVETVRFVKKGVASKVKYSVFSLLQSLLRIAYHKVFYRRLLPRIPLRFGRVQWKFWLRMDY